MQENSKPEVEEIRMTAEEWRKTHRDFKAQINGRRYVLGTGAAGTTLVPVVIEKETKA